MIKSPFPTSLIPTEENVGIGHRKFMTTLVAVATAAATGVSMLPQATMAETSSAYWEEIAQLYYTRSTVHYFASDTDGQDPVMLHLIRKLIQIRPGYLDNPIREEELRADNHFTVASRALPMRYTVEAANDLKEVYKDKAEEMILDALALEWANTMDEWAVNKESQDLAIRFHTPIKMIRAVEPITFQPVIGFMTRYAEIVRT